MTPRWEVSGFRLKRRTSDRYPYVFLDADLVKPDGSLIHRVQLVASPTGRNVHVFIDGKSYVPEVES